MGEDVFSQYLPDDAAEELERQRKAALPPPSPRPKGPVTALVRCLRKDDSWDVQQAALEALTVFAPRDRADVIEAVRPLLTHPAANMRRAALLFMATKVQKLSPDDRAACNLRLQQDRDEDVRAAAK